jgi:hypothetical protein
MHPEKGMGVEFKLSTSEHRAAVEKFLSVLTENRGLTPELLVKPEALEPEKNGFVRAPDSLEDPLLQLFYGEPLSTEEFHEGLRRQRTSPIAPSQSAAAGVHL